VTRVAEQTDVGEGASTRSSHLDYAQLLGRVDLFSGLDRVTLAKLAARLQPESFPSGVTIIVQGEPGETFYLVAHGSAGVYVSSGDGPDVQVKVLHDGEPFGEMALLTSGPRTASVKAETDCEVLRLDRSTFLSLVRDQPSVALSIAATLSRRLANMMGQEAEKPADRALRSGTGSGVIAPRASTIRRWWTDKRPLASLLAIAVLGVGLVLPAPSGLSQVGWHALVILAAGLVALVFDALLEGIIALLLAGAWVVFGVVPPAVALSGFSSPSWVLVTFILIAGTAITSTGLLYRCALEIIVRMRGGFSGEITALSLAGLLVGPAIPNATSRVIIIAPMLQELVEALGYQPRSRPAAGLAMAALTGFGQMTTTFLTSSTTAVLAQALLPPEARASVNWITWAYYAAPTNIILFVGLVGSILWLYRPNAAERPTSGARAPSLALQRALLGPTSRNEKVALAVGIGLLLGFMTQPLHGIDPAWVAVLATAVLAATGIVTVNTLRAVNWNFILLFGSLISLTGVFARTGLDSWLAAGIVGASSGLLKMPELFLVVLVLFCFALSFVVRWQAAAPLVMIALFPVANSSGIHPVIIGVIAVLACNTFFLPYQSTVYLAAYTGTEGKVFTHRQTTPAALAYAVWTIIGIALSAPVWRLMGLIQ
jgi:anion transporter